MQQYVPQRHKGHKEISIDCKLFVSLWEKYSKQDYSQSPAETDSGILFTLYFFC